jgi:UDP-3-O-[3-hydroxymyristoyl] glucosamine N-acyltransferase
VTLTLRDLVARLGGEAVGDSGMALTGVASLDSAGPGQIAFFANPKYRSKLEATRAAAVIVSPGEREATRLPRIVVENPYAYYARTVALFHPEEPAGAGVHATAQVDPAAQVDAGAEVGAYAVIGARARIGPGARIGAHCFVGRDAAIGEGTRLHARVTIYDGCTVGRRCLLHSGAVVGADGFGMARDAGAWVKIPQVGRVRIGDDVEIGANTTIDRGALDDTVIEDGVKLDNLIQVAHNCVIGAHTVIAACTGIAGSVAIGRDCVIGGGVGFAGHISVCDGVTVTGMTFVTKSIRQPGMYSSAVPAMPHGAWMKTLATLRRLEERPGAATRTTTGDDLERNDD